MRRNAIGLGRVNRRDNGAAACNEGFGGARLGSAIVNRDFACGQMRTGDHRRQRVQQVVFGFRCDGGGEVGVYRLGYIGGKASHYGADSISGQKIDPYRARGCG